MEMTNRSRTQVKKSLKSLQPLCGECSGFKCEKLIEKNKTVCSQVDKTPQSKPCSHFLIDTQKIAPVQQRQAFEQLVSLFQEIPDDSLRSIASILFNEHKTRRQGYYFGQKVYVRYRGAANADYLSNFMIAHVISANNEHIRLSSLDSRCTLTYGKHCFPHILSPEKFDKLRAKMINKGRMVDPDVQRLITKKLRAEEEYELNITSDSLNGQITTIDTVFKENKVRRKGKRTVDLVDLVNGMMHGHDVSKDSRQYKRSGPKQSGDYVIAVSGD